MNGYNAFKDGIHKQKSSPIHHQNRKVDTNEGIDRTKVIDRLPNDVHGNPSPNSREESLSTPDATANLRMGHLELDHYGYLLGKIVRIYLEGDNPYKEVF